MKNYYKGLAGNSDQRAQLKHVMQSSQMYFGYEPPVWQIFHLRKLKPFYKVKDGLGKGKQNISLQGGISNPNY